MLAASGRYSEAAEVYREAIARAPDDIELRLLFARALGGAGRREEALEEIRLLLERAPTNAEALALRSAL